MEPSSQFFTGMNLEWESFGDGLNLRQHRVHAFVLGHKDSASLHAFGRYGRSAPNLLRRAFPIIFSLLPLICFWRFSLDKRISDGVVG